MKNNQVNYLIFDIGGTFIKWALTDHEKIIKNNKFAFDSKKENGKNLISKIGKLISEETKDNKKIRAFGISTCGDVDSNSSLILGSSPNILEYAGLNFKKEISQFTKLPFIIENDANCAAIGEFTNLNNNSINDLILLTLGTDIGCGIYQNKKLFKGHSHSAGEAGYMNVLGRRWGTWFSARGLLKLYNKNSNSLTEPEHLLLSKDLKVKKVLDLWYKGLAIGIANLITILNPQVVLLGGGLSEQKLLNLDLLKKTINKNLMEEHLINSYKLDYASLGNTAAIYGCIWLLNKKFDILNN